MLAIAMTAAPRASMHIKQAVESLRGGGFHETVHVFAEPGCRLEVGMDNVVLHLHPARLGARANWTTAVGWLSGHFRTSHLLVVEDDVEYCRNARRILDTQLAAKPQFGYLGLFCPVNEADKLARLGRGWIETRRRIDVWGTVSLCLHCDTVQGLLRYGPLMESDAMRAPYDYLVRTYYRDQVPWPCYVHVPSLTEHHGWNETTVDKKLADRRLRYLRRGLGFSKEFLS
jgi:hypothetical protein